jgi:hypothetical protein
MTDRDVRELIGHMVLQMREAEMRIEVLTAENRELRKKLLEDEECD